MARKAGMVHAVCSNVRLFNELASEIMPGIEVVHLVDEGLPFLSGKNSGGLKCWLLLPKSPAPRW